MSYIVPSKPVCVSCGQASQFYLFGLFKMSLNGGVASFDLQSFLSGAKFWWNPSLGHGISGFDTSGELQQRIASLFLRNGLKDAEDGGFLDQYLAFSASVRPGLPVGGIFACAICGGRAEIMETQLERCESHCPGCVICQEVRLTRDRALRFCSLDKCPDGTTEEDCGLCRFVFLRRYHNISVSEINDAAERHNRESAAIEAAFEIAVAEARDEYSDD